MTEIELYKKVIKELEFQFLREIEGDLKHNLYPLFSTSGTIEYGFNKESLDKLYWGNQLNTNTYELWCIDEPTGDDLVNSKNIGHVYYRNSKQYKLTYPEDKDFIIIGYNKSERLTYLECVISDKIVERYRSKTKSHNGLAHKKYELDKDHFYSTFKNLFRNEKIDLIC